MYPIHFLLFMKNSSFRMRDLKSMGFSKDFDGFQFNSNGSVSFPSLAGGLKILDLSMNTSENTSLVETLS